MVTSVSVLPIATKPNAFIKEYETNMYSYLFNKDISLAYLGLFPASVTVLFDDFCS